MINVKPGWQAKFFPEVFKDATSKAGKVNQDLFQDAGRFAIVDQGKRFIAGRSDNGEKVWKGELPVIIFGDHTRVLKLVDFPFILGADGTKVLTPKSDLDPHFAYYLLKSIDIPSSGYSRHFKYLKEQIVTFPRMLVEQQRIADILARADRLRQLRRYALQLSDSYLQAVFLRMFGDPVINPMGWKREELGKHLSFLTSGSRGWAKYYNSEGERFIRSLDVQMNHISNLNAVYVTAPDTAEAKRTQVFEGDVLLTVTGSRIGRVAPVTQVNGNRAFVSQHVAILRPKTSIDPRFLSMYLSLESGGQRQIQQLQYGQTKPGLGFDDIRSFKILLPPIDTQNKFLKVMDRYERLRAQQREAARQANHLFGTLLHRVFRGTS